MNETITVEEINETIIIDDETIIIESDEIEVIEVAEQGLPGKTGTPGEKLEENILTSNLTISGIKATLTTAENLAFGDVCYVNASTKMAKGNASVLATASVIAIYAGTGISIDETGVFLLHGFIRNDAWTLTVGFVFLSVSVSGGLTQTYPNGSLNTIQIVGFAVSSNTIFFNPQLVQVEHK